MFAKEYKTISGQWICAPDSYLEKYSHPKTAEFPTAEFIWSRRNVRCYFRRVFTPAKAVQSAFLHLWCNNGMAVYLNGNPICAFEKDTGKVDVTNLLTAQENLLAIKAYQTAEPHFFTSGLTGGVHLEYEDGTAEDIVTDGHFENVRYVGFFGTEEPKDWYNDAKNNVESWSQLLVTNLHAAAVKRSCYFKTDFSVSGEVVSATLEAAAQGFYEPHVNGQTAEEVYMVTSSLNNHKEYQVYDITDKILQGKNTVGALLGNGWLNCDGLVNMWAKKPALYMELTLTYADGRVEKVQTGSGWQVCVSPFVDNDVQFGERYDARLEVADWDTPHCAAGDWAAAGVVEPAPFTELLKQNYPLTKGWRRSVTYLGELEPGVWLYDCGIDVAGAVELTLHNATPGQQVEIHVFERFTEDGKPQLGVYTPVFYPQDALPDGKAPYSMRNLSVYTAKGGETETYSPKFCYTGLRYVYVKGLASPPAAEDVVVREMHNDLEVVGQFRTADEALNRLWDATLQTWFNNCQNAPTDCPTREKNFWDGDTQMFTPMACWMTHCGPLLGRWSEIGRKMKGPYGWEDEIYMIPWTLYQFYGQKEILEATYPNMLGLWKKRDDGNVLPREPYSCYNDWLNPWDKSVSPTFFAHCWHLNMYHILSKVANVLGDAKQAEDFARRFKKGKELFNKTYYLPQQKAYNEPLQAAQIFPLAFGLVPQGDEQAVADTLYRYIRQADGHLTTGFPSTRYVLELLTDYGYGETALELLHQTGYPSWNYLFETGATNITETWRGHTEPNGTNSMSHFALAAPFSWFYEYLGGIRLKECAPGFKRIVLEPHCFLEVGECKVSYKCPYGEITSEWYFDGKGELHWSYTVPKGVQAEARQPKIYK